MTDREGLTSITHNGLTLYYLTAEELDEFVVKTLKDASPVLAESVVELLWGLYDRFNDDEGVAFYSGFIRAIEEIEVNGKYRISKALTDTSPIAPVLQREDDCGANGPCDDWPEELCVKHHEEFMVWHKEKYGE